MECLDCEEYIAGFCPNEEFFVDGISLKCPNVHSTAKRSEYSSTKCIYPFDSNVLSNYKKIILEVDGKIKMNFSLVNKEKLHGNLRKSIDEVENAIDKESLENFDVKRLHQLLIIHGKIIEKADSLNKEFKVNVCNNCSHFITEESGKCTHPFCVKYEKLRKIASDLETKMSNNTELFSKKL